MLNYKFFRIALLFTPLALLSACGVAPAYGTAGDSAAQTAGVTTVYYGSPGQPWANGSDTPQVPAQLPPAGPVTTGKTDLGSTAPAVYTYCKVRNCFPVTVPSVLPVEWKFHIPIPIPDPAPQVNQQVVYGDKVFQVVGVSNQTRAPSLILKQIAQLKLH